MAVSGGDFVLISLSVQSWAGTMSVPTENPMVRLQFQLLKRDALAGTVSAVSAAYRCLDRLSLQFKVRGVRALPVALVPEAEEALREARTTLDTAVEALIENYEASKADAIASLPAGVRSRVRAEDYPTPNEIREKFSLRYSVFSVGDAPVTIDGGQDVSQMLDEFKRDAASALVGAYLDQMDAMRVRLNEGSRFHVTSVEKFSDFLNHFEVLAATVRNPTTSQMLGEVQRLVTETRSIMAGVVPDDLRRNRDLRAETGRAVQAVFDEAVRYTSTLGVVGKRKLQED